MSPLQALQQYWGYPNFRKHQEDVITSILKGDDTVALLATGAGKSLCYQLPAVVSAGKTVVVSPLIALMMDQVNGLKSKGINAGCVYSGMSSRELDVMLDNFVYGPMKILYASPERVDTDIFKERYLKADISLLAVDEAHCISQWGYDFRPAYFKIQDLRELKPNVPIIAVTATATNQVTLDIQEKLGLAHPTVIKSSYLRDNLSLSILRTENKEAELYNLLHKLDGSGIIYMRSRAKVQELSDRLNKNGIKSSYYHGGMNTKRRQKVQDAWIEDKQRIIVSTNAFGMGVDKSNVRFVIHYDIPPSIEEYYQEVGRAGRDGAQAYGIMIINHGDVVRLQSQIQNSYPEIEEIKHIYNRLSAFLGVAYGSGEFEEYDFDLNKFSLRLELPVSKVYNTLEILAKDGWIMMSNAISRPSQVVFTSDKKNISLSTRNKGLKSEILLYMLRKYEGLFIDYTSIYEQDIAEKIGVEIEDVIRELKIMHREAILSYKPTSELPIITYIRNRPAQNSFQIDEEVYMLRKKHAIERMNAMVKFVFDDQCRFFNILEYFDEKATECGKCDICKGAKREDYSDNDISQFLKFMHTRKSIYLNEVI